MVPPASHMRNFIWPITLYKMEWFSICKSVRYCVVGKSFALLYFLLKLFCCLFFPVVIYLYSLFLRAPLVARNPNVQVVITHVSHVCGQHSLGLPLRMYGMRRMHFDQAPLDFLSLVNWSRVFWPSVTWNFRKAQPWSKSVLNFDCCPRIP